jgi:NADH-quinone oxidoreductase subunit L
MLVSFAISAAGIFLAYSTVSQLGFMFVGVGVLAPVAGVFHLVTHAFFKALLFLSSGVVMHAMSGILDMREMSGLKAVLPKTRWLMLIGCLALAGMFPFSGFFSKDEIVGAAMHGRPIHVVVGLVLLLTAFLTAYYTFRLYFRVFEGPLKQPEPQAHGHGHDDHGHGHDDHGHGHGGHHNHEPMIMIAPLIILALGACVAGFFNWPSTKLGDFLGRSPSFQQAYKVAEHTYTAAAVEAEAMGQHEAGEAEHAAFNIVMLVSFAISAAGIFLAYSLHLRDRLRAERMAAGMPKITGMLEAKYWVDELYQNMIVEPLRGLGQVLFDVDRYLVDGLVAAVGWVPQLGGWAMKLGVQRGSLQGYAAAMLFGVVVILILVFM